MCPQNLDSTNNLYKHTEPVFIHNIQRIQNPIFHASL